jgi:hypothetical protein
MVGGLMFYSGKGKLFDDDGNGPAGIQQQFEGTFLDTFPGTDNAWLTDPREPAAAEPARPPARRSLGEGSGSS